MARAHTEITNFTAGEVTDQLDGRTDISKYYNAVKRMENFIIRPHGPASRRGGTRFVAETRNSGVARLVRFQFSVFQAYIIEFGNLYARFFKDHGQIMDPVDPNIPYEISTPYTADQLWQIKVTQSADVLYINHPDHPPRKLSRTDHNAWTLSPAYFEDGPFLEINDNPAVMITPSGRTGSITLTASAPLFYPGHVGSIWRLRHNGANVSRKITGPTMFSDKLHLKNDFYVSLTPHPTDGFSGKVTIQKSFNDGATWYDVAGMTTARTTDMWEDRNDVCYRVICKTGDYTEGSCVVTIYQGEHWGLVQISGVNSSTSATAQVLIRLGTQLDDATDLSTSEWREGAWSAHRGYPSCCTFFEDRLVHAGTRHQPQTFWASKQGDYENMVPGTQDTSALTFSLLSDQVNAIRWVMPKEKLVFGAIDGEWVVGATNPNEPMTPKDIKAHRPSTRGVADIQPVQIGSSILYVQRAGMKIREFTYDWQADSFVSQDMTVLAEHIAMGADKAQSGIKEIAHQQEPDGILWCVRNDGVLLGLTYLRDQEVVGWHRHITKGAVESIAVVPAEGRDELWLVVRRKIAGQTRRFIEYMESYHFYDQTDAFFVDCGATYTGAATQTLSGLDHLEGCTVQVLADGSVVPDQVVRQGGITLPRAASKVHAGLKYVSTLQTMRLDVPAAQGTSQSQVKRIGRAAVRVNRSIGFRYGPDQDGLEQHPFRARDPIGAPVPLFSGDKEFAFPGDYDSDAHVLIVQEQPLPLNVVSIYATAEVNFK